MTKNKILAAAMAAAGLAGCSNNGDAPPAAAPAPYAEGTTVTLALLETTDLHANVMSYNY
jgi:2',3'-cyclic-nucleotide 2'-phosphodiesterase/3'-nucleotidase